MKLNPSTDEFDDDQGEYSHDDSSFLECRVETANQSLTSLDCTPLKKVRSNRTINYGKRKSDTEMRLSRISGEGEPNVIHGDHAVHDNQYAIEKVEVGSYIGCLYDRQWFVGLVRDLSFEHNDVNVKFMHPKGPANAFFWPDREDNCWVLVDHLIGVVQAPQVNRS